MEELEDRFGSDQPVEILEKVKESLSAPDTPAANGTSAVTPRYTAAAPVNGTYEEPDNWDEEDEQMWDDTGEGAGVEGELDVDDD